MNQPLAPTICMILISRRRAKREIRTVFDTTRSAPISRIAPPIAPIFRRTFSTRRTPFNSVSGSATCSTLFFQPLIFAAIADARCGLLNLTTNSSLKTFGIPDRSTSMFFVPSRYACSFET